MTCTNIGNAIVCTGGPDYKIGVKTMANIDSTYEEEYEKRNAAKIGNYENPENGCPNCGRYRVMRGDDGKRRCEKCAWCIDDNNRDIEFLNYME